MDRVNPTFNFVSDSEDSDSSSSSERERKKAYLLKQSVVETIKPSTIIIEENKLANLVNIIEMITTLSNADIESPTFDENARSKVQCFLTSYAQETLFTFSDKNTIFVDFTVPKDVPKNTTYFIKLFNEEDENLSLDFSKMIIFGKIDHQVEATLISTLKMVFICSIFNMESIPYRIKRRVTKSLEDFSLDLTENYYRNFGISEIYLPALSLFDETEINQYIRIHDVISSFEKTVVRWGRLINEAIHDNEIDFHVVKDFNILTLIHFWEYKLNNLHLLLKYLNDENVIKLCEILRKHNSIHLNFIFKLQTELEDQAKESQTIIAKLQNLKQIHEKIDSSMVENILTFLPQIFQTVNALIQSDCIYFQSSENTKVLLTSFSQQIINICRKKISVSNILRGETTESMKKTMDSLKTCNLFNQMLKSEILNITCWKEISQTICNSIEAFMRRCNDLLELCSIINIFTCSQNSGDPVHIAFEQHIAVKDNLRLIYDNFSTNLIHFKRIENKILYVQCSDWYTAADSFQNEMKEIESKIIKFTETSFNYVTTTEDELNVLRMLYHYSKLHSMKALFIEKYDQFTKNVLQEIKELKNCIIFQTVKPLIGNWMCLDIVTCTFLKKRRLQFLSKLINDCSWLNCKLMHMKVNFAENIVSADAFIIYNYKEWLEVLNVAILNQTKRPLVAKCFYKPGLLEVNIDRNLFKVIKESKSWVQIGLKLPAHLDKLTNTFAQILILYGNVEDLVMTYNRFISSLSSGEYVLFLEIISVCSEHISPTLYTMQWDYDQSNDTVLNYLKQMKCVENSIKSYKQCNKNIIDTCNSICSVNFLHATKMNLEEIKKEMFTNRLICLKKMISYYNVIVSTIQTLFSNFGYHIYKMKEIWNLFVEKVDILLENALLCCIINSLKSLFHNFCSTSDLDEDSLVKINIFVAIQDKMVKFEPDLNDTLTFFAHVDSIIIGGLKIIPRLYNKFKLSKGNKKSTYAKQFSANENISQLQQQITIAVSENLSHVKEHIQFWYQYRSLWKIDAECFALEYCKNCSSAEDYRRDFLWYSRVIQKIENSNFNQRISLFIVNTENLSNEVVVSCKNRLNNLSNVLRESVFRLMNNISSYIEESNNQLTLHVTKKEYLTVVTKLVIEISDEEKDIQKICDYVHILSQFKFQDLKKEQELVQKSWLRYKNTLERNRLKAKIMYNVTI